MTNEKIPIYPQLVIRVRLDFGPLYQYLAFLVLYLLT